MNSAPSGFLLGTGFGELGFKEDFITDDVGATGARIRVRSDRGTIQQGRTYGETVGVMCHEYGHVLGLPDLFNVRFLRQPRLGPEEDSAGIGNWGLMG